MSAQLEQHAPPMTIAQFFAGKKKQIEAALPKHMTADRLLRIVMTEIRKTPKLKQCTIESLFGSVIQCAQLGLEPGSALGHAYLLPYDKSVNKGTRDKPVWTKITECQLIIGYRGMIDLSRRSGQIISINAQMVYENDKFAFEYGLNERLVHAPNLSNRGKPIAAYAVAKLQGGGYQFEVMPISEINKIRDASKAAKNGPWVEHYDEMARKTVIRRIFKYLPVSIEIATAIKLDEDADRGEQDNKIVIEGEYDVEQETGEITPPAIESKADNLAQQLNQKLNKKKEAETVTVTKETGNDLDKSWEDFKTEE